MPTTHCGARRSKFVLDGLPDKEYAAIAAGSYVHVEIRLGWWDLKRGFVRSALAALGAPPPGGLDGRDDGFHAVLEGRVLSVERTHGELAYRAASPASTPPTTGCRRRSPSWTPSRRPGPSSADATGLCPENRKVNVPVRGAGADIDLDGEFDIGADGSVVQALRELARLSHGGSGTLEVPMFLRAGELHRGLLARARGRRPELGADPGDRAGGEPSGGGTGPDGVPRTRPSPRRPYGGST